MEVILVIVVLGFVVAGMVFAYRQAESGVRRSKRSRSIEVSATPKTTIQRMTIGSPGSECSGGGIPGPR